MVGVIAVGIACIVGMSLGLVAGYFGRWTDNLIMRGIDVMMSLPPTGVGSGHFLTSSSSSAPLLAKRPYDKERLTPNNNNYVEFT
jgi:hypothetical protein